MAVLAGMGVLSLGGWGVAGFDTTYALVWGRDLRELQLPLISPPAAPTPHPLGTFVGAVASVAGAGAGRVVLTGLVIASWVGCWLAASWLASVVAGLRRTPVMLAAVALAVVSVLARPELVLLAKTASLDVVFVFLCLVGAAAYTQNRPAMAFALLVAAACQRPEGWLMAVALFLAVPHRRLAGWMVGLLVPPAAWLLLGLFFGDPWAAITATRSNASILDRDVGLVSALTGLAPNLASGAGWAAVVLGSGMAATSLGGMLARCRRGHTMAELRGWSQTPTSLLSGLLVLDVAAYLGQGILGTPLLPRYLLLAHVLLASLAAAAVASIPQWLPGRASSLGLTVVACLGLAVTAGTTLDRYDDMQQELRVQNGVDASLHDVADTIDPSRGCGPVYTTVNAQIPVLAAESGRKLADIEPLQGTSPGRGLIVFAKTPLSAFDAGFGPPQDLTTSYALPAGFHPRLDNGDWVVFQRC